MKDDKCPKCKSNEFFKYKRSPSGACRICHKCGHGVNLKNYVESDGCEWKRFEADKKGDDPFRTECGHIFSDHYIFYTPLCCTDYRFCIFCGKKIESDELKGHNHVAERSCD